MLRIPGQRMLFEALPEEVPWEATLNEELQYPDYFFWAALIATSGRMFADDFLEWAMRLWQFSQSTHETLHLELLTLSPENNPLNLFQFLADDFGDRVGSETTPIKSISNRLSRRISGSPSAVLSVYGLGGLQGKSVSRIMWTDDAPNALLFHCNAGGGYGADGRPIPRGPLHWKLARGFFSGLEQCSWHLTRLGLQACLEVAQP